MSNLPSHLPAVGKPIKGKALVPIRYVFILILVIGRHNRPAFLFRALVVYRYFYNTVTFDYTAPFWDFDEWSLELDWLALRGVNLPLQWVGYEYILVQVFREAGLSDAEITSFLSVASVHACQPIFLRKESDEQNTSRTERETRVDEG